MNGGRKAGIGLVMVVLVLLGLLLVADRGAAWVAEDRIAGQVAVKAAEKDIAMRGEPEVTVEGFPFLTQVIGGEYDAVTIRMRGVALDGVTLDALDIRAAGVQAGLGALTRGSGEVRARQVTGRATIPFSAVEEMIGIENAEVSGSAGRLVIRVPVRERGVRITVVAHARLLVSTRGVTVKVEDVEVAEGDLPPFAEWLLDSLARDLSRTIPLPALPYGLKLDTAHVTGSGISATASARDVPLLS